MCSSSLLLCIPILLRCNYSIRYLCNFVSAVTLYQTCVALCWSTREVLQFIWCWYYLCWWPWCLHGSAWTLPVFYGGLARTDLYWCRPGQVRQYIHPSRGSHHLFPVLFLLSIAQVHMFDHQFPTASSDVPLVVLYGELGTSAFATLHSVLSGMATSNKIQYVVRHHYKVISGGAFVMKSFISYCFCRSWIPRSCSWVGMVFNSQWRVQSTKLWMTLKLKVGGCMAGFWDSVCVCVCVWRRCSTGSH